MGHLVTASAPRGSMMMRRLAGDNAPVAWDTFTLSPGETAGERVDAHVGEIGTTWLDNTPGSGYGVIEADGLVHMAGTPAPWGWYCEYRSAVSPPRADYTAYLTFIFPGMPPTDACPSLVLRAPTNGVATCYQANFAIGGTSGSGEVNLDYVVGGNHTHLADVFVPISVGVMHTCSASVQGAQIIVQLDGQTIIGPLTDTALTATGQVGFSLWYDTTAPTPADQAAAPCIGSFVATCP